MLILSNPLLEYKEKKILLHSLCAVVLRFLASQLILSAYFGNFGFPYRNIQSRGSNPCFWLEIKIDLGTWCSSTAWQKCLVWTVCSNKCIVLWGLQMARHESHYLKKGSTTTYTRVRMQNSSVHYYVLYGWEQCYSLEFDFFSNIRICILSASI